MKWPFLRSKSQEDASLEDFPECIIGKDGAEMVLIPAGEFEMGSNDGFDSEKLIHTVYRGGL